MAKATSIPSVFTSFSEEWSPRLVAEMNDQEIKIARINGGFIWHAHPDTDELFYLIQGTLTMQMEATGDLVPSDAKIEQYTLDSGEQLQYFNLDMKVGDIYVVPRGHRHRPVAWEAQIMVIEKKGTVNTGDVESKRTVGVKDARNL